ncbi:MAG: ABC transporter substrate-binding protein [Clostridiales bacterium]|nr:ABC transporter substrate-binding protein [Clostridiales bacterium]
MKAKRMLALLLVLVLTVSAMAACGSSGANDSGSAEASAPASETTTASAEASASTDAGERETLVINVLSEGANYQGLQGGWYGKILKDKFNIELNITALSLSGESAYQTRLSTGDLGDIVQLGKDKMTYVVNNGLVRDIRSGFAQTSFLKEFLDPVQTVNNSMFPDKGEGIYVIPCNMTGTSPTEFTDTDLLISTKLRWDLYKELGEPDIADLNGLLDVLEQMQKNHPVNEVGDSAYALSLWKDWDGFGMANVTEPMRWYDQLMRGSLIFDSKTQELLPVTEKNTAYYKVLKFLNDAYLRGLVDPDSGTQDWSTVSTKIGNGQVYLLWYIFTKYAWNTEERKADGSHFLYIPVQDQKLYMEADIYYGAESYMGIGANVEGEKYERIMEFLDWYDGPENWRYSFGGIEGFNYEKNADGKNMIINPNAQADNLAVPEEYGGGGYADGMNQINFYFGHQNYIIDPDTKEQYNYQFWSSVLGEPSEMDREWQVRFGADNLVDYLKKNDMLDIGPNVVFALEPDTNDISVLRGQCQESFRDYSWKMVFAEDQAGFDALWEEMAETLNGLGYEQLAAFDAANYASFVEATKEALR